MLRFTNLSNHLVNEFNNCLINIMSLIDSFNLVSNSFLILSISCLSNKVGSYPRLSCISTKVCGSSKWLPVSSNSRILASSRSEIVNKSQISQTQCSSYINNVYLWALVFTTNY